MTRDYSIVEWQGDLESLVVAGALDIHLGVETAL